MKKPEPVFDKLTSEQLSQLYNNYVYYRDNLCKGWARLSVIEFYNKFGLSAYKGGK
jgi:hypothetical protein